MKVNFELLNQMLKEKDEHLDLYIVGGYALQLYGVRDTNNDIDAYYEDSESVKFIISNFCENNSLDINNEVSLIRDLVFRFNKDIYELKYSYSNLKIYIPEIEYMVIMKTVSASIDSNASKHINDIVLLAKKLGFSDDFNKIYEYFEYYNQDSYGIKPIIDYLNSGV